MHHPKFLSLRTRPSLWALAAGAALALTACGGGDSDPAPPPGGGPISNAADRIEPYDPPGVAVVWKAAPTSSTAPAKAAGALAVVPTVVLLEALAPRPAEAATQVGQEEKEEPGGRQHIGVARQVAATATPAAVRAQLQWQATGQGTQRAALRFRSEGAFGVRLGVQVQALPPGSTLSFYGSERNGSDVFTVSGAEVLAAVAVDGANRTYWSPDFGGPETTLELELPAGADPAQLAIAVPVLSHFFIAPAQAAAQSFTKALAVGSCSIDAACLPDVEAQSRSVARVLYVDGGGSYQCTATLLNDADNSTTPYLLTAQHCIGSQAAAETVTTDWFYRASACNSGTLSPATRRLSRGATLLYSSTATDTAFIRLNEPAPAGTVFAGSYFGALGVGAEVLGLHQPGLRPPQLGVQKVSEGKVEKFFNCSFELGQSESALCQSVRAKDSRFLGVVWSVGNTEQGSSGSPLFVTLGGSTRYVAGQLLGGTSSCQEPRGTDYYGRFDVAFNAALKQWLKP